MNSQFSSSAQGMSGDTTFQVNQTLFGYVLLSKYEEIVASRTFGKTRKGLSVLLLLAISGLWLTPNAIFGVEILAFKFLLSALYVALSTFLLFRRRPHSLRELQVDLKRGELRAGFRGSNGVFHLEGIHAFDDVDVVSIWNPIDKSEQANLLLRLADSDVMLIAAQGERPLLEPYRTQLASDLCAFAGGVHPVASLAGPSTKPFLLGPRIEPNDAAA